MAQISIPAWTQAARKPAASRQVLMPVVNGGVRGGLTDPLPAFNPSGRLREISPELTGGREARAIQQAGESIGGAVNAWGEVLEKEQQLRTSQALTRFGNDLDQAKLDAQNAIAAQPGNPDQWDGILSGALDGVRQRYAKEGNAAFQELADERFQQYQLRARSTLAGARIEANLKTTRAELTSRLQDQWNAGDMAGAAQTSQDMAASGAFEVHEMVGIGDQVEQQAQLFHANAQIEANPLDAKAALSEKAEDGSWANYRDLPPEARESLIRQADQTRRQQTEEGLKELGAMGRSDPAALDAKLADLRGRGLLTPADERFIRDEQLSGMEPELDVQELDRVRGLVRGYDANKDASGDQFTETYRATFGLPDAYAARFRKELDEKRYGDQPPNARAREWGREKLDLIDGVGGFGVPPRVPTGETNMLTGEPAYRTRTPEEEAAAAEARRVVEDDYLDWLDANPNATTGEVNEWLETRIEGDLAGQAAAMKAGDFEPVPNYGNEATPPQASLGEFGGLSIQPAGTLYEGAIFTVFGGQGDKLAGEDNGLSAWGGKTGYHRDPQSGARVSHQQGVAMPAKLLHAYFGTEKRPEGARVMVQADNGRVAFFPIVDKGTAEWVWERGGKPTLDLTEGAVEELGGIPRYSPHGALTGIQGFKGGNWTVIPPEWTPEEEGLRELTLAQAYRQMQPAGLDAQQAQVWRALCRSEWSRVNNEPVADLEPGAGPGISPGAVALLSR